MRRLLIGLALGALVASTPGVSHAIAEGLRFVTRAVGYDLPIQEPSRVRGHLALTVFSSGCQTPDARAAALRAHQVRRVVRLVRHADAAPGCRVERAIGWLRNTVVDAGEAYLVDAWQGLVTLADMRYHALGTSATAIDETQTSLVGELTSQYNPNNTRATGTLTEGGSANIFQTVGSNTLDAGVTVQEWALMSQAAVPGGTMWSRVLTGSVAVASGGTVTTTYALTIE